MMSVGECKENSVSVAVEAVNTGETEERVRKDGIQTDARGFLTSELDGKSYKESLRYVWNSWTQKPRLEVKGYGWIFHLLLKLIRWHH